MQQVDNALEVGKKLEDINTEFRLSVMKPLHAKWLVEYYNHISSEAGTKVIVNGFKLAGIYDVIRSGKLSLQSIDPFNDITPLTDSLSEGNCGNFVRLSDDLSEGYANELDENESEDDEDTEWGLEDGFNRNAFGDFITDVNSRTEHYVISFISNFNLLFLVFLAMFKKKNEKKTQVFDLLSG